MWENRVVITSSKCVFCDKRECKRNGIRQRLIECFSEAKKNEIFQLLIKLGRSENQITEIQAENTVFYHTACFNKAKNTHATVSIEKTHSSQVFKEIKNRIEQAILIENNVLSLADVYEEYSNLFEECLISQHIARYPMIPPHQLLRKLLSTFSASSNLAKTVIKNRTFIHPSGMSYEEVQLKILLNNPLSTQTKTVAFEIRRKVLEMKSHSMPKHNLSLQDVLNTDSECPSELHLLIECLLKGPRGMDSQRKDIRISKICDDIIFCITDGRVKPTSSISLGIVTKSVTGSRQMIEMLNKMGHCISYHLVEEIETELAYGCEVEKRLLPIGLNEKQPQLSTHVAFDNFDRYVETNTGKDTLHDTVGIVYQNKSVNTYSACTSTSVSVPRSIDDDSGRRRRKFQSSLDNSIEPITGSCLQPISLIGKDPKVPENWKKSFDMDNTWMFCFKFDSPNTKRWVAWNAGRVEDKNPTQIIGYLPNLNQSPTDNAVIMKTLQMSNQIADECNQAYIVVSYDLAIAMKAYAIKDRMSPNFDRIFVNLGGFHIEMSYFKVCFFGLC